MTPADKKQREQLALEIIRDQEQLAANRGPFEAHCQHIAERYWPSQSKMFQGQIPVEGEERNEKAFDSTPCIALTRFASICDSLITPRNSVWHELMASDPLLNKDRSVRLWFEEVNRILYRYRYAPMSNFAGQNNADYKMIGAFGNGVLFTDPLQTYRGKQDGVRYKMIHLAGVFFRQNHQGIVDEVYRRYKQSARNAIKEWGKDNLPESVVKAAEKSPDQEFDFIHCVKPRKDYDPERVDHKGMTFASYYVCVDAKMLLDEGGYNSFPYSISRFEQTGENYGRSPAMDTLPATRTLNEMKKTVLKQGHKAVDPALLTYDDGIVDAFSLRPGAINPGGVSAQGNPMVHAIPVGNVAIGKDMMDDERAPINDAFFVTLFQILVETPTMTATEVMERTREKGILLAPSLGNIQDQRLGTLIDRELDILMQQKKIPPPPPVLMEAKGEYTIQYNSPLSRTARAEQAAGALRTIESAITVASQTGNPAPLDVFDFDTIWPEVADINGMPESWRNSEQKIAEIRQARAQAAQEQQAIQAAPGAAAMIKSTAAAREMDRS